MMSRDWSAIAKLCRFVLKEKVCRGKVRRGTASGIPWVRADDHVTVGVGIVFVSPHRRNVAVSMKNRRLRSMKTGLWLIKRGAFAFDKKEALASAHLYQ